MSDAELIEAEQLLSEHVYESDLLAQRERIAELEATLAATQRERDAWQESHEHHESMRYRLEIVLARARELPGAWRPKDAHAVPTATEAAMRYCADELERALG